MNEFEFILEDRIAKIRAINEQYDLEHNAYISFSGGKDSTILHHLIDLALPNNRIPRIFANTGIEYIYIYMFVKELAETDDRIIMLKQTKNIKKTLETYGYPFKSKEHALRVSQFNRQKVNAPFIDLYINGKRRDGTIQENTRFRCPKILLYQFQEKGKYNYSNQCCYKLKKALLHGWQVQNKKTMTITGMRAEEGGSRARLGCLSSNNTKFHPLIVVSDEWEDWFIKKYNIKLCKLYYPPYNFVRTGCVGCPFALELQEELLTLKKLLPTEYKRCLLLWKPVYDEYVRLGYRLDKDFYDKPVQYNIFDYIEGENNE